MPSLPPSLTNALHRALPTLAAGALAGSYVILTLATGHRDGQMLGYALALGLAVLVPFEATALWLRHGAPLPALPALPPLREVASRLAGPLTPRRTAPDRAAVIPAE